MRHQPALVERGRGGHLVDATLHAYVAGEVDPPQRSAVENHLERCELCRQAHDRVQAVHQLFQTMAPEAPDELSWRRVRERVRSQLEQEAALQGSSTLDLVFGRRWVTAGLVAAVAVALLVWFAPRPKRGRGPRAPEPAVVAALESPKAQVLTSGDADLQVTLASGARLRLAPGTRVVAPDPRLLALELELGLVDLSLFDAPPGAVSVTTPGFRVAATSRDFSVGHWARQYVVEVREGAAEVQGEAFGGTQTVRAGERRVVQLATEAPARAPKTRPKSTAPRSEPPKPEGDTRVEILDGFEDEISASWRDASQAFYRDRDLDRAVRSAERVLEIGAGRPEVRLAQRLLCEALIARREPRRAVDACSAVLPLEPNGEERRHIHYVLATLYRAQLGDCRRAIPHYGEALVFGREHHLDEDIRLFRASCAVEVGDLVLAASDLLALEARGGHLARPAELDGLRRRLAAAQIGDRAQAETGTLDGTTRDPEDGSRTMTAPRPSERTGGQ